MNIDIRAKAEFQIPVRRVHVQALMVMSAYHYDHKCKAASREGGFLYGWKNEVNCYRFRSRGSKYNYVSASTDEIDTCLKIMENSLVIGKNPRYMTAMADLQRNFLGAIQLWNVKYPEWVARYEGTSA
jgi:hypothetical protein